VGKGALAPCPPPLRIRTRKWWARFALPTYVLKCQASTRCHRPRKRAIQYSRGGATRIEGPRRTGSPGQAGPWRRRGCDSAFPRRDLRPGLASVSPSKEREGAGNTGCRCTRSLVCSALRKKRTRALSRYNRTHSGVPRAMLDDLFRALLGVPGVLVTVPRACALGFTPASGCRDHAALSNASGASSCAPASVHRNPPHVW
jgi:hypothetical protein